MRLDEPATLDRVQSEQIRTLLSHTPVAILAHLAYGGLLVAIMWTRVPHGRLAAWFVVLVALCLGRFVLWRYHVRNSPPPACWRSWAMYAGAVITGTGLMWGIAAVAFLDVHDPVGLAVIVVMIVAFVSGAAVTSAPYPPALYGFGAAALLPLIFVLLASGTAEGIALALVAGATLATHPMVCRGVNRVYDRSLRLAFENEALRLEAERANAAKTRFLAAASHDLRQPIHALGLSFGALAHRVRNEQVQPVIEQVEEAIAAVDTMLSALLDISKIDAGIVSPVWKSVCVAVLFRDLNLEFQSIAAERGNRLAVRSCEAWVRSDAAMLRRILQNLLGNALRYTANGRVLLAARRRGDQLRFEVYDTGVGIPSEHFREIFLEFQQLGNPQRDRRQGLGLGLAIVKRLADLLGHRVGLSSAPGRGSRFWVEVALAAAPVLSAAPAGAQGEASSTLCGSRILVLDDEPAILRSVRDLLEHWGCAVDTAMDIEAAMAAARDLPPDLLIVDHRLAEARTGLAAVEELRGILGASLPALIITGDTAPERLREAQRSGHPLLHKPVQPARLRSAIQALLGSGSAAWPRLGGLGPGTEAAPDDTPDATSGATV